MDLEKTNLCNLNQNSKTDSSCDCTDNAASKEIFDGMNHLINVLNAVSKLISESGKANNLFYQNSWFVFRGISKFYQDCGNESPTNDINKEITLVKNSCIRSSLSVRLRHTSKKIISEDAHIRAYYVNALEEMIRKAKNLYPNKYNNEMSDLDILADIQHYGGATCLVDFSKNVLTSIWFACNSEPTSNGYLYCYNVMEDMIKNDSLSYIKPEDENKNIASLIAQTYTETNVCSDIDTRFCLWEPSKKNNRIFRQDSVFLFGIEEFKVKDHGVNVIGINAEWKLPILSVLKAVFNISGSTIFSDYFGFANNMNKKNLYKKMRESVYSRGYMSMIKGNYQSALNFLKLSEISSSSWDVKQLLELHFSLGVCYKNLGNNHRNTHYSDNAILEYKKAIEFAQQIVKSQERNSDQSNYYKHKAVRAYNQIINLLYKLSRYDEAIKICKEFILNAGQSWLKGCKIKGRPLTIQCCQTCLLELEVLELLHSKNKDDLQRKKNKYSDIICEDEFRSSKEVIFSDFFSLLNDYYKTIWCILFFDVSGEDIDELGEKWTQSVTMYIEMNKNTNYILWNFVEIKDFIDSLNIDSWIYDKKNNLQKITAHIIGIRDLLEMSKNWGNKNV